MINDSNKIIEIKDPIINGKNFMLYIVIIVLNVIIIYFKILILLSFEQLVMIFDNLKLVD